MFLSPINCARAAVALVGAITTVGVATVAAGPAAVPAVGAPMAPRAAAPSTAADSSGAWPAFFRGRWGCTGAFASGKPLAADLTFSLELDGRWLAYRHVDRPPGRYRAAALWGPLPADGGPLTTVLYDNGGGQRRFASAGWADGALVLVRDSTDRGARPERFTFRHTSDSTFWFAWERGAPGGAWALGDSLACRRAAGQS